VSRDLCEIAARAGFRVTVVDDRASFANVERFPLARRVLAHPTFEACFAELSPTASTYCVVVTRGHAMDLECTGYALGTPAPYVGLIGSKVKVRAVLGRLRDAGTLADVDLERLHAPIGLDLGAATPGEIAVAVVAELIAHRRGRLSGLSTKRLPVDTMRVIAARPARDRGEETPA
jgi:xanthine dehydrogenase accessory factor